MNNYKCLSPLWYMYLVFDKKLAKLIDVQKVDHDIVYWLQVENTGDAFSLAE